MGHHRKSGPPLKIGPALIIGLIVASIIIAWYVAMHWMSGDYAQGRNNTIWIDPLPKVSSSSKK